MTRWLVTGAAGMLGRDLVLALASQPGVTTTALGRAELDLTVDADVARAAAGHDIVVNAAAWTDVDGAETYEAAATEVNGNAVAALARACAASGARLIHPSTDYVFAGDATIPYEELAPTAPVNAYGRSKLMGEQAVLDTLPDDGYVVRTAWLYGAHGRNFVSTMLRLAEERETVEVVNDQTGQPTWSQALARRLAELGQAALAGRAPAGIYHGTASGQATWYEFARAVFARGGHDPDRVRPTSTVRFRRPARRPSYSVLAQGNWAMAGLPAMADWQRMLGEAMASADFVSGCAPKIKHSPHGLEDLTP